MKKARLQVLKDAITSFIKNEDEQTVYSMTINEVLGELLSQENRQSAKSVSDIGKQLCQGTFNESYSFEVHEAISLMRSLTLSREQMRKLRYTMLCLMTKGFMYSTKI